MAKLFIDTHVHIYPEYHVARLLNSAFSNFKEASRGIGNCHFVLALTERFDCDFYKFHKEHSKWQGKWELKYNSKSGLITASREDDRIYILPGRQNISAEKLEVLTLGSDDFRAEGLPAIEIIKGAQETRLVTILPWSFGKWWGSRGKLVKKLLKDSTLDFALGDPAHRFGSQPPLFKEAEYLKRAVLCGTDPLPLADEEYRVCQYGNIFEFEETELSSANIVKALLSPTQAFGRRISLASALAVQLRMRM